MKKQILTWKDGTWHEGNPPMLGPMVHSFWMASAVFDGARAFNGLAPDLDRHCQRVVDSARSFGMKPKFSAEEITAVAWEGIAKFPADAALYVRPLYYFGDGFVVPDPDTTDFMLTIFDAPLPEPTGGSSCISTFRRPMPDMAPTEAKASCLYPNVQRAMMEARDRGFGSAVMLDALGHVAEFTTSNIFIAKDGLVQTPVPNGTFLAGLTRKRVIGLLRDDGIEVLECTLKVDDVLGADEVFQTGNFGKVLPLVRVEDSEYQPGPFGTRARELYMDFADREGRPPA